MNNARIEEFVMLVTNHESRLRAFVASAAMERGERYIQSAKLNGKPLNRCWLTLAEITAGGTVDLVLGPRPNRRWASNRIK